MQKPVERMPGFSTVSTGLKFAQVFHRKFSTYPQFFVENSAEHPAVDVFFELVHGFLELGVGFHLTGDLFYRVHYGGMIFTVECLADVRVRHIQQRTAQIHGDLAGKYQLFCAFFGEQIFNAEAEVSGHRVNYNTLGDFMQTVVGYMF